MKFLSSIVIIVVIALIGSRLTFFNRKLPLAFRIIIFTGIEYIFIGVLLGEMGVNLINAESLNNFEPFLIFAVSWIGFLFGLQFKFGTLKNLPRFFFPVSAIQAAVTFALTTGVLYFSFKAFVSLPDKVIMIMALTLGSAACCTAQSALAVVKGNYRLENRKLFSLLQYISGIDGLFALCFLSLTTFILPYAETSVLILNALWRFSLAIGIGMISALILIILSKAKFSQQEFIVFIIGVVLFGGGLAIKTHNSPLVTGFICGILTANFCRHRLRALETVTQSEKSVYIVLLILLGAGWTLTLDYILVITGIYFSVRIAGKMVGTFVATRSFRSDFSIPPYAGLGLISEGGLAVAIIINFSFLYPSLSDYVATIVIVSMFISEIISPRLILSQFDHPEPIEFGGDQSAIKRRYDK
ncbi:MAG: cation:proton antiporter [Thermodesulfobacteriota bacterium]